MARALLAADVVTARTGKALIDATRPFAVERPLASWWYLGSTLGLLVATSAAATANLSLPGWPVARVALSVACGLLIVRAFIVYHDFMHGALLRRSRLARALLYAYAMLALTPPRVWRETHNYHHAHTAKIVGSHVGSYAMVTADMWRAMSSKQRLVYRAIRSPLTIALGYFTVFVWGMCVAPFARNPRKNWDSAASLVVHLTVVGLFVHAFGVDGWFFGYGLPLAIATALGAYLFYAQHNFPGMHVQPRETWSYTRAALESSSYMEMGRVMRWFTGNIGYHHVHHLNPLVPFYRLPEVMAALPELQHPGVTHLSPHDLRACFAAKVWDPSRDRMVSYDEVQG